VKFPAHRTDSGYGARGRNRVYFVKRRPAPSSRAFAYFENSTKDSPQKSDPQMSDPLTGRLKQLMFRMEDALRSSPTVLAERHFLTQT
jgi:hypothetical protein